MWFLSTIDHYPAHQASPDASVQMHCLNRGTAPVATSPGGFPLADLQVDLQGCLLELIEELVGGQSDMGSVGFGTLTFT